MLGLFVDFKFDVVILGIVSGPIGFVVPFRFRMLDSQSVKSKMGPVPKDFDGLGYF